MKTLFLFVLFITTSFLITFLSEHLLITDEIVSEHLSTQLSVSNIDHIIDAKNNWFWLTYAILPILYFAKIGLISIWILSGSILYGIKISFGEIYKVVLISEFVWLIPSLFAIIWFGFIDTDYTLIEVQYFQPLSLLSLFDPTSLDTWLIYPFKAFNLFEVAYMFVLAFGIKRMLKTDYTSALNFTVPVYGTALITWIVFVTFLSINLTA